MLFAEEDYGAYLEWLGEAAKRTQCQVHAYVLMTNHVHLLVTPANAQSASRMMVALGRQYVPYINAAYQRSGTLWEGRYKSSLVQSENYLLACMRYIELNPVRAGMCADPANYRWSQLPCPCFGRGAVMAYATPVVRGAGTGASITPSGIPQLV